MGLFLNMSYLPLDRERVMSHLNPQALFQFLAQGSTQPPCHQHSPGGRKGGRPFTFGFLTYYRTSCPSTPTFPARGHSWDGRMGIAVRGGLEETEVGTLQAPQDSLPRVTYQFPISQN